MSLIDILGVGDYQLPDSIDQSRLDLALEFFARPLGRHSDELQLLLSRMRSDRKIGRYILVRRDHGYSLGKCPSRRGDPYHVIREFPNREDAERFVFAVRWEAHTGQTLPGFAKTR